MEKTKPKKVEEIYKNVNQRSIELSFRPTGPVKNIGQRTPVYELIKEIEEEESKGNDT